MLCKCSGLAQMYHIWPAFTVDVPTKAYRRFRVISDECLDDSLEQVTSTYFLPSALLHTGCHLPFDLFTLYAVMKWITSRCKMKKEETRYLTRKKGNAIPVTCHGGP
jgi:hypothetical protein